MIIYNLQKIKIFCNYDIVNILQYFCLKEGIWIPSYLPKEYSHKIYLQSKEPYPVGNNYILNISPLLKNTRGFYIDEIYGYILLASCRSYFDYKVRGIDSLPVIIAQASNMDYINNPLLNIIDDNIHFRYETETNRGI